MKYSIFYLIKGNAEKYRDNLVKIVGPRFAENYVVNSKLPAHITLKTPFEIKNIKLIENTLKDLTKRHRKQNIEIRGFGNFRRFVVFLIFRFSKPALKIREELIKRFKEIKGTSIRQYDKKWNPHATISYCNTKKSFNNIWNYLKKLDKPYFKLKFDNITIMKKTGRYWKIHKKFMLK